MLTVATTDPAVLNLLNTASKYGTFFTDAQLREAVERHMPNLPPDYALICLLQISDALMNADIEHFEGRHNLGDGWAELARMAARNVIEHDQLVALRDAA